MPAEEAIPAFGGTSELDTEQLRAQLVLATEAWLGKTGSEHTRKNYGGDLRQFLAFTGIDLDQLQRLTQVRPRDVQRWRDPLAEEGKKNRTIMRKMMALRSLFSYLQVYGYTGANPAHSDFVTPPPVSKEGETPEFTRQQMRTLLDAPDEQTPVGIRDRAIWGIFAYTAIRVSGLIDTTVGDYRQDGGHKILRVINKGNKEKKKALHPEAVERLEAWLDVAGIRDDKRGPLFRAPVTPRGQGRDGYVRKHLTRQAVAGLFKRYAGRLGLSDDASVHSLRVTATNVARDQGVDIFDLQDWLDQADPRTTEGYLRKRERLSKSPGYAVRY